MTTIFRTNSAIDTNILVYSVNRESPFHRQAYSFLEEASEWRHTVHITQQSLLEFSNVMGRAYNLTKTQIQQSIEEFSMAFTVIQPLPTTFATFLSLYENTQFPQTKLFDLYLIATCQDNGIEQIYTVNVKDFNTVKTEIEIINPFAQTTLKETKGPWGERLLNDKPRTKKRKNTK